jgi:C1A family cysteine protease
MIVNNKEIILSEQQLVDCDKKDNGCRGGLMEYALDYIINAGGLQSTSDYPYMAFKGQCKFDSSKVKIQVEEYYKIKENEENLKEAIALCGPISIGINASDWQLYNGGIFNNQYCSKILNHGVLVVGYGTDDETGLDYWIIKNSW